MDVYLVSDMEDEAKTPDAEPAAEPEAPPTLPATTPATIPDVAHPIYKDHSCSCLRCGHQWHARKPNSRPTSCPRCGSALWDRPPVRKNARRPDDPPNPHWKYRLKPIKKKCPTCGKAMRRFTVAERKEQARQAAIMEEIVKAQREKDGVPLMDEAERVAIEQPARPRAVSVPHPSPLRPMTPPPGMQRGLTPLPLRQSSPETPEVQASRTQTKTLSEMLTDIFKENS